jgi:hypothetical protein
MIPSGSGSLERFVRAAAAAKNYRGGDASAYLHKFLDEVALSGEWRIGYIGAKEIHFRNKKNTNLLKKISMNQDFDCRTATKVFKMDQAVSGNVQSSLEVFQDSHNEWLVNSNFLLPANLRKQMMEYPETHTKCMESFLEN